MALRRRSSNKHARSTADHSYVRLSWLWLALGIGSALVGGLSGQEWIVAAAAWLGPIFLIRFLRTQPIGRGLLVGTLASIPVALVTTQGMSPLPGPLPYVFAAVAALIAMLPYLTDRLLAARRTEFVATLVFPLALTTLEYLNTLTSPFGTWGATAYSQYGILPLMQIVSVTGIWGLTFLIAWGAAVVNWAWEQSSAGADIPRIQGGVVLYAGILGAVLLFGLVRLVFFAPGTEAVRVAAISPARAVSGSVDQQLAQLPDLSPASEAERAAARLVLDDLLDHLLGRSREEARRGAYVVVWNEGGGLVLKEDKAALIERARSLAQQEGIYLGMGLLMFLQTTEFPFVENKVVMIDCMLNLPV